MLKSKLKNTFVNVLLRHFIRSNESCQRLTSLNDLDFGEVASTNLKIEKLLSLKQVTLVSNGLLVKSFDSKSN